MRGTDELNVSGIYKITNTINGKFYIGSSRNIRIRWNQHRGKAEKAIGNAIKKYGIECFLIEVLEEVEEDRLLEREQYYLDTLTPFTSLGVGYNISPSASGTLGYRWTDEQKNDKGYKIDCYDFDGNFVKTYNRLSEAEEELDCVNHSKISHCLRGNRRSAGGYLWVKHGDPAPEKYERTNLPKKVLMYDKQGNFIKEFSSSWYAAKDLFDLKDGKAIEKKSYSIQRCCNKQRHTAFGYVFRWKEE